MITSSVTETVVQLHFEDGQQVNMGDLLVTLKQDEEQASLREQQEILREQEREVARLVDLASRNQVAMATSDRAIRVERLSMSSDSIGMPSGMN